MAAIGVDMVDAAVSGAQWGAQEADLVFMVGGSPESVARVAPILSSLGEPSDRLVMCVALPIAELQHSLGSFREIARPADGLRVAERGGTAARKRLAVIDMKRRK